MTSKCFIKPFASYKSNFIPFKIYLVHALRETLRVMPPLFPLPMKTSTTVAPAVHHEVFS